MFSSHNLCSPSSSEKKVSLEDIREVVIRLKMIEWGIHGLGGASAGLFLAYHHLKLGPYFGDVDGNEWPYIPLHKEPTNLEYNFNQLLSNITFAMSNETLNNISILDLPAFGSTIGTLKTGLKEQFVWPTKLNFASLEINPSEQEKRNIPMVYKSLTEDWAEHMRQVYKKDYRLRQSHCTYMYNASGLRPSWVQMPCFLLWPMASCRIFVTFAIRLYTHAYALAFIHMQSWCLSFRFASCMGLGPFVVSRTSHLTGLRP